MIWETVIFQCLKFAAVFYLGLCLLVFFLQSSLLYHPYHDSEKKLCREALLLKLEAWKNEEGERIGWKSVSAAAPARVIIFHGNAGHALHRAHYLEKARQLSISSSWEVYLFEYPGYGSRFGSPSEKKFLQEGSKVVQSLLDQDSRPLYLIGESLGCAVAVSLAAQFPEKINGLLLITPFDRLETVAAHHFPWLPVRWFLKDRYLSDETILLYPGPVAVVLAAEDQVVPIQFGKALYEKVPGRKRLDVVEETDHNDLCYWYDLSWWNQSVEFLANGEKR